ncbi:PfkB family carbohydrate kinase [Phenylobacterium deserti]|uniref:pyridoxal kinase n=1 Tax=Phenylobacterium deserti TaxID=1914756 RepID=A0A328ASL1_9CAUL|nr:PfkB family carbohydrate kinase [Phenylobacterium deserti]RAK57251.1 pyridoxine kinase [Phenylobacterium deserti]
MSLALILSSFVSAARIGGAAQQYVLAAHKIDPVLAPTVLLGRSPAKGAEPQVTAPDVFRRMLGDIEADAIFGMVDLVITGHFSDPDQVEIAAGVLERVREGAARQPVVVVDPIMGDEPGGLYVKEAVAERVAARLVPLADWVTPNAWELARLTGLAVTDVGSAAAAAQALGRPALVTSVPMGEDEIGLLLSDGSGQLLFSHPRVKRAPNGTGDLVAASFGAGLIEGMEPAAAAERASRAAAEAVQASLEWRTTNLPIVALAERVVAPTAQVRIQRL